MLGKTHMVVGITTSLAVMQPESVTEVVIGTAAAAIGGVISDIDVSTSVSHKEADKISLLTVISIVAVAVFNYVFRLDIYQRLLDNSSIARIGIGMLAFIGICVVGKEQPHRSFMHSILALILLSGALWVVFPVVVPYFAIAFLTHLVTDLFNFKDVRILYPIKKGICLHMFHAKGIANTVLCAIATIAAVVEIIYFSVC